MNQKTITVVERRHDRTQGRRRLRPVAMAQKPNSRSILAYADRAIWSKCERQNAWMIVTGPQSTLQEFADALGVEVPNDHPA